MGAVEWTLVAVVSMAALVFGRQARAAMRRRRRRLPATIKRVRIEALDAVCVEDDIVEQVWRIAILMKNIGRKPAPVPPFAARATVRAASREYVGAVSLEQDVIELNPGAQLVAWVDVELPAGAAPQRVKLPTTGDEHPLGLVARMRTPVAARS